MNTELWLLRMRLTAWGRLCRAVGIGYPTMSTTEKARVGRGGRWDGPSMPDYLMDLDSCIARSPPQHKLIIVEIYTKSGNYRDHAARLNLSVDSYYRRKKSAEVYLNAQLTGAKKAYSLAPAG